MVRSPRGADSTGNLHAWARQRRYDAAESLRVERGLDWIAVAHTRSDLAETMLYRLATSPGTRALAAMPARRGAVIRPLLALSRAEVREAADSAGLPFVDDRSNDDPAFARARIRGEVLPVLADLNPAVLDSIASTRAELGEELDFISDAASGLIRSDGTIEARMLEMAHPALRRHALRLLAERGLGRPVALGRERAERICRLAARTAGGSIDLGGGAFLVAESGTVAVETESGEPPGATTVPIPGKGTWAGWQISAEAMAASIRSGGAGGRDARRRPARREHRGAGTARGRSDRPTRNDRFQVAAGSVHRCRHEEIAAAASSGDRGRRGDRLGARTGGRQPFQAAFRDPPGSADYRPTGFAGAGGGPGTRPRSA